MKTNHLLFGTAYYSEYLPYDRVDEDMDMMVKAGMNTIRIAESTWSTLEPHDDIYDFKHIDRMLAAASSHDLSVIVGTPTYAVPAWLVKKYPGILPVTHDGQQLYGHRQNMDLTNPNYLQHAERIVRKLMEHVNNHPCVIGFQIDNEAKHYDTCSETAQKLFVNYLKKQFPDLDAFNREFGLDYWSNRIDSWDDFPDIRGCINGSLNAEYKKYQRKIVTDFLMWQSSIVQEYIHPDQFITHNFDFSWTNYSYGYQCDVNQYDAAKCVTVAGADVYHPSQNNLTGAEITCCGNISRSLKNDNYLVLETQAQGRAEWLAYDKQLRLQAYSHIANGANSVMYWHWHSIHNSFESYWKGILSHDFRENTPYREICQIGAEWKGLGKHLINLKKKNHIAVLLDNNSLTGLQEFPLETTGDLSYNTVMRWITDALFRLNLEYDMLPASAIKQNQKVKNHEDAYSQCTPEYNWSDYDYIIVPALYSAKEETLLSLNQYVAHGGNLIVTFKSAFSDEHIKIRHDVQPYIIHECLGIEYDQFTYPHEKSGIVYSRCANSEVTSKISEWMELIRCTTADSLASYTDSDWSKYSAITTNTYEKGHALYLATMFDDTLLEQVLSDFIECSGHKEYFEEIGHLHAPLIHKSGTNNFGKKLHYYFNYSDKIQEFDYTFNDGIELLSNQTIPRLSHLTIGAWDVKMIEEL